MRVKLIWHTPSPERVIAIAMRRCYSTSTIEEIEKEIDSKGDAYIQYLVRKALNDRTFSVLEHVVFTFEIEGISRVCSHQLIRHRIASYNQESQRFTLAHKEEMVIPPSIQNNPEAIKIFDEVRRFTIEKMEELLRIGIPKEDARFILPQCVATKLIMTMNARSLMHFLSLRLSAKAQWEIRELASRILEEVRKVAPTLFEKVIEC
ncbi:MAG: FAD-dependent thymidylate synthase [Nitrososphaerales archaeon]|nr:FAD-dependent thymidylate synthase [Nitrososphaerales archaeon]MCX8192126.1 FAD-dependent thymidylate synthase [Nitrososphaerales archaeon]